MTSFTAAALALCGLAVVAGGCGDGGMSTVPGTGFSCPAPVSGKVTVCGQIADVETGASLEAVGAAGAACDTLPSVDGPCSVAIRFYDASDFAANPSAATPIAPASLYLDDLGRYRAENLTSPSSGFFAVSVNDALGTADRHRPTAVLTPASVGTAQVLRAFVTADRTDTAWSTSAGLSGSTFADLGVVVAIFHYHGLGRAGVTITRNGSVSAADDYYFTDAGQTLTTVGSPGPTGASGGALLLNSGLVPHSGTGGEPDACQWPSNFAASIAGVVFVQVLEAQTGGGAPCP